MLHIGGRGKSLYSVLTAIIFIAREVFPCSCTGGAQASLNKARLHSCTEKRERHYHIDGSLRSGQVAHQQFPAFPGGCSLAFSDFELIKARGDGKAMLSL